MNWFRLKGGSKLQGPGRREVNKVGIANILLQLITVKSNSANYL